MKNFTVLAIDTSCDETSAAVVQDTTVLSNVLPSQMEYHKKYGGVVPNLARLAHQERIGNVVNDALKKAQVNIQDLDAIAVTLGPGLAIALEVGIKKAKELAEQFNKPLVTVNHMEGHLLSAFAERKSKHDGHAIPQFSFPTLGFLVSGSHTELILIEALGKYEKVGETLDDSCGEAYDKCGRMLGLGYPAGPVISEFARRHRQNMNISIKKDHQSTLVECVNNQTGVKYVLPVAMASSGDLNFSYSGLKTAFKQLIEELIGHKLSHQEVVEGSEKSLTQEQIYDLCVAFEAAALAQLTVKLEKALKLYSPKEIWLGGGVVASARLRSEVRKLCRNYKLTFRYPTSKKLTGDNAAMIGVAANFKLARLGSDHDPKNGIYRKEFEQVDRDPTLSL